MKIDSKNGTCGKRIRLWATVWTCLESKQLGPCHRRQGLGACFRRSVPRAQEGSWPGGAWNPPGGGNGARGNCCRWLLLVSVSLSWNRRNFPRGESLRAVTEVDRTLSVDHDIVILVESHRHQVQVSYCHKVFGGFISSSSHVTISLFLLVSSWLRHILTN